ncbi:MAG TPA: macro domain-containing protein [Mycobacteriales bacterium]|nr:macro domain-containing protein [Mycobacteriales bacterium]
MAYTEVTGDLFALGLPAIGHGCNCAGVMVAGIAVEFRRRWPRMYDEYRRRCRAGKFRLGGCWAYDAGDVVVYNLATQREPGAHATLGAIERSVATALADVAARGLPSLGLPRLGAGIGGLRWDDVREVLRAAGEAAPVELVAVTLAGPPRR